MTNEARSDGERVRLATREGYDRWSEVYDHDRNPLVVLEEPLVREWIGSPRGSRVADVGCGTGRHALWLAAAGAEVDAFEFSGGMLGRAREKLGASGVRFHEHALPDPLPIGDATFDVVLLALVADHLADLERSFRELRRVVKRDGRVIVTVLHPAMNLKDVTARFTDPASGREVRVEAFEHAFGDYVMALVRAGFALEEIAERRGTHELAAAAPRAAKYLGWPMLLALRARPARA